jgi:hypothetical protein
MNIWLESSRSKVQGIRCKVHGRWQRWGKVHGVSWMPTGLRGSKMAFEAAIALALMIALVAKMLLSVSSLKIKVAVVWGLGCVDCQSNQIKKHVRCSLIYIHTATVMPRSAQSASSILGRPAELLWCIYFQSTILPRTALQNRVISERIQWLLYNMLIHHDNFRTQKETFETKGNSGIHYHNQPPHHSLAALPGDEISLYNRLVKKSA